MVDWNEVWSELLKTADGIGISRYVLGERMFGKDGLKKIYQKKTRVCRCMCEDLLGIINEEIKSKKLLKAVEPDTKKAAKKTLKTAAKTVEGNTPAVIEVKETTADTIKAAIDEIKAKQVKPLIAEQDEPKEVEEALSADAVVEEQKENPVEEEPIDGIRLFSIEEEDEEVPLFKRIDKNSFLLEDYFYRMQYSFKIISGRAEVDEGDHILLFIKTNGDMKPYILSADQFKEFVGTGKVNHWFSARLPKEVWDKMGKETYNEESSDAI